MTAFLGSNTAQGGNNPQRGICTLGFKGKTLRFRTNPNSIWWTYNLITSVDNTYGGRVVQILGANLGDLVVNIECGRAGWNYNQEVVRFMRDMINDQRKGDPGTFWYTTRNWHLKVFAASVPMHDAVNNVTGEMELRFKVQEDVSGVQTSMSLTHELNRLKDGIGFTKSKYNTSDSSSWGGLSSMNGLVPGTNR